MGTFRLGWLWMLAGLLPVSNGQLSSISVSKTGSQAVSSTSSAAQTTISKSSSGVPSSSTTVRNVTTTTGGPLVVTTVFTAPSGCNAGFSGLVTATDYMFDNIMNPLPGLLVSSCYPSQFFSSAMATVSLPPFQQLVCPSGWSTVDYNSTYVLCCPWGFSVSGVNTSNIQRPAAEAICYSRMPPDIDFAYTVYNSSGSTTVIDTSVGPNGAMVLATLFDGTPASTTVSNTGASFSTSSSSSLSSSSSASLSSTPSTPASASISVASSTTVVASSSSTKASTTSTTLSRSSSPPVSQPASSSTTSSSTKVVPSSTTKQSVSPTPTLTPDNSCGNQAGGNGKGYTCNPQLSGGGSCCSKNGYCGNSGAYCGAGCQPGFGTCGTLTPDNSCGMTGGGNNKGYFCNPSLASGGTCCSQSGYCGNSTAYCGTGCQSNYGTCN